MLTTKINNLFSNNYVVTGVGVGAAQFISILTYPVIAKLLGPEVFTEFSFLMSFSLILLVILTLKLENALFIVEDFNLLAVECFFQRTLLITTVTLLFLCVLFSLFVSNSTALGALSVIFSTFWASQFEFYIQKNIRTELFRLNAVMRIVRAASFLIIIICLSLFGILNTVSAIIAYGFSNLIPSSKYVIGFYKEVDRGGVKLYETWLSVKDTVLFLTPAHFTQKYFLGSFVILCSYLKSDSLAEIGMFALAFKLTLAPVQVITAAIADVFKRTLLESTQDALSEYIKLLLPMALFFTLWVIGVFIFGEFLVGMFLGEEWLKVIEYCISLLPYLFALLFFSPLTHAFLIFKKQRLDFSWQLVNAISITILIYVCQSLLILEISTLFSITACISLITAGCISLYLILNHSHRRLT